MSRFVRAVGLGLVCLIVTASFGQKPRARDLGLKPGVFAPGKLNAITDVAGVKVGQVTLIEGNNIRTGVTAILPHGGNLFQDKVAGGAFVGNAFGKLAGSTQVNELGQIETPIVLTNTLSVGTAVEAVVSYTLSVPGNERVMSVNAVVGETNDWYLNDIRGLHVTNQNVIDAIQKASDGPVQEGTVGAGTGTIAFNWKGGIGTSSRVLPKEFGGFTVGVLVQTNYGGILTMGGTPVGKETGRYAYHQNDANKPSAGPGNGSCMIVIATDAPVDGRGLQRLAARGVYALGRTGSDYANGSGDFAIAFSTSPTMHMHPDEVAPHTRTVLPADAMSPLFEAVLEATEEAVYNSMLQATTVTTKFGNETHVGQEIPVDKVREILARYGIK
jgi:D-aminopeptidase